jgi:osmoprotectant transport system substrate-binding protein
MVMGMKGKALVRAVMLLAVLAAVVVGCGGGGSSGSVDLADADFIVGSKDFTEQQILGYITLLALEDAGATVEDQIGLAGTSGTRQALESGDIDMYWEYTGTIWITHLGHTKPIQDSKKQYEAAAKEDLEKNGLKLLEPAPFNNTYALAIREEEQKKLGVEKLSDLGKLIKDKPDEATLCTESEFRSRDDGLPGMEKTYGYEFPKDNISLFDTGVVYDRTDKGEPCNFGSVFTTDGRIAGLGLYPLEDDKTFFPIYNPALEVKKSTYDEYGKQLDKIFTPIAKALDTNTMQKLNAQTDVEGIPYEDVAQQWLEKEGFVG